MNARLGVQKKVSKSALFISTNKLPILQVLFNNKIQKLP